MRWTTDVCDVELLSEPTYSFGSADNVRSYEREYLLSGEYRPSSTYGVRANQDGKVLSTAALGAAGGGTHIHEHSAVLLGGRCVVAVGDQLVCLRLPDLVLLWAVAGDDATCFGVYASPRGDGVVVHGELAISKFTLAGEPLWRFTGRDIFTGGFRLTGQAIFVTDFDGMEYNISPEDGRCL
jgi:hypothetical protein